MSILPEAPDSLTQVLVSFGSAYKASVSESKISQQVKVQQLPAQFSITTCLASGLASKHSTTHVALRATEGQTVVKWLPGVEPPQNSFQAIEPATKWQRGWNRFSSVYWTQPAGYITTSLYIIGLGVLPNLGVSCRHKEGHVPSSSWFLPQTPKHLDRIIWESNCKKLAPGPSSFCWPSGLWQGL